jgi:nucleotide-binding universal stress UspA family protein
MDTKNYFKGDEPPKISRSLVATDFSAQASSALEWARSLTGVFGAELVLLHVINIFGLAEVFCVTGGPDPLLLFREQAHKSMGELKALVSDAQTVVYEGSPSHLIVDTALDLNCQMIVMGTHGRSGLVHLLLGSVAEYVVRSGNVPLCLQSAPIETKTRGLGKEAHERTSDKRLWRFGNAIRQRKCVT